MVTKFKIFLLLIGLLPLLTGCPKECIGSDKTAYFMDAIVLLPLQNEYHLNDVIQLEIKIPSSIQTTDNDIYNIYQETNLQKVNLSFIDFLINANQLTIQQGSKENNNLILFYDSVANEYVFKGEIKFIQKGNISFTSNTGIKFKSQESECVNIWVETDFENLNSNQLFTINVID